MQPAKKIVFSNNHNNKLNATFFTAIGLCNDYAIGDKIQVWTKQSDSREMYMKKVAVENKFKMVLSNIPDIITQLDSELDNQQFSIKIKEKYATQNIDWTTQPMYVYLLKTLK